MSDFSKNYWVQMESPEDKIWVKKKTSEIMLELSELGSGEKITLIQMLKYMRGRAFGMVMVLMSILSLIPNLFGHVIATGSLLGILGFQMALGFAHIRLPRRILEISFSRSSIKKVVEVAAPKIEFIEKFLRPRLIFITEDVGRRIIGIIIIPLSLLILIPFPFSNFIPSFGILTLSLGLIEKDGFVVLIGILISTSTVILINEILKMVLR